MGIVYSTEVTVQVPDPIVVRYSLAAKKEERNQIWDFSQNRLFFAPIFMFGTGFGQFDFFRDFSNVRDFSTIFEIRREFSTFSRFSTPRGQNRSD